MGIKIGQSYSGVEDMLLGEYPDDPEYVDAFVGELKRQQIAQTLFMMRTHHGLTQDDMAKRMGVTQSAIAKLEDRGDEVRMNDVIRYAEALGYNTLLQFTEGDVNLAGMMRWHLESVVGIMERLEVLAANDPDISLGVLRHFTNETRNMLSNVLPNWTRKTASLQKEKSGSPPEKNIKGKLLVQVSGKSKKEIAGLA